MIKTTVDNVESNLDRYLNLVSSQDIHITKNGKVIAILTKPKEEYSIDKLVGIISNSDIDANFDRKKFEAERLWKKYESLDLEND